MKTSTTLRALACAFAVTGLSFAADTSKTINGEAMCAKCELKSQDTCQTVIQVKEGGMVVTYYVAPNEVAKSFHGKICHDTAQVTATGTVSMVDGKQTLTASAIEVKK